MINLKTLAAGANNNLFLDYMKVIDRYEFPNQKYELATEALRIKRQ